MGSLKRVARRFDDWVSAIDPDAFERLLAEHYRRAGYVVHECGAASTRQRFDGGVDLRLYRGSEVVLVQCKRWNAYKVAHNEAHELLGIVVAENATRGILVNAGEFTEAAKRAAASSGGRLELVDGVALRAMLGTAALPASFEIANALRDGFAGYRRVQRAWYRTKLAGSLLSLAVTLVGGWHVWNHLNQALNDFSASAVQRSQARAGAMRSPALGEPGNGAARGSTALPAPRLTRAERSMRQELVRNAAKGLNGVTSAAWLSDRALFLGMGVSTDAMRADAVQQSCDLLSRYPELPQMLEIQQTSGDSDGRVARFACARTTVQSTVQRRPSAGAPALPEIVMYGSPNCTYCRQAEAYFARNRLPYRNLDITHSAQANAEFKRLGGRGTPLIVVNGKRIHGLSVGQLDAAIAAAGG